GAGEELQEVLAAGLLAQIEHDRFFVAVVIPEEERALEPRLVIEIRADPPRRIAFGWLDLGDLRTAPGAEEPAIFGALVGDVGEPTGRAAPAKAAAADDVVWRDYYTRLPQSRLTGDAAQAATATEVMLDGNDVAKLVECAVRHPNPGMRYAVLAAIWNDPQTF